MKIVLWIAGSVLLAPILYMWLTGPVLIATCAGWLAMTGHRDHYDTLRTCLKITERFQ